MFAGVLPAQRIRIPQSGLTSGPITRSPITSTARLNDGLVPVVPQATTSYNTTASATLGAPTFDPYATAPDAASSPPSLYGTQAPPPGVGATTPYWQTTPSPGGGYPGPGSPIPGGPFPQQPPVLFPNGINLPGSNNWPQAQPGPYMRLFQDIRFRYTWLTGKDGPREMETNDVELGTTVNFPNFMWSGLPLHISPVFVFHFWDGPDGDAALFPTALPSRVYSTYLNFAWQPMLTPSFGGDIDASIGVYSDFDKVSKDSVRIQGTGVFVLALTPTVVVKAGVNYLDRVDLQLLPAFGFLWTPNPQTRFDVFFPKPKLAQYLTTVGNTDVWWYLNGEYGGGSWTVDRPGLVGDRRMDINDIRVGGGLEWTGYNGVRGFVETAYVFDRKLVFASGPADRSLKDTIMVRGGLSY